MADGDEKIDHNDRVLVLNRVSDDKVEIQFNGVVFSWKPREVRSIQRLEADHMVKRSTIKWDPTYEVPPVQKLVIVDETRAAIDPGLSTEPLTAAECKEIQKYGQIDTTHLPPDRLIGNEMLMDPETGQYPSGLAIKGAPRGGAPMTSPFRPLDRGAIDRELDHVEP